LIRLLLDPTASGGGAPAPSPTPAPTPTPAPPPSAPVIPITVEQHQAFLASQQRLAQIEADNRRLADEAQQRAAAEAQSREQFQAAAQQLQARIDAAEEARRNTERNWLTAERDRELASALAGLPLLEGDAPNQFRRLIADDFEARLSTDGRVSVVERATGRPVADVVRERGQSPAYAHFMRARGQGGTGAAEARPPATGSTEAPATLGQALLSQHRAAEQNGPRWLSGR
jgi:hypothetical protein